jgi:hypothetical protein
MTFSSTIEGTLCRHWLEDDISACIDCGRECSPDDVLSDCEYEEIGRKEMRDYYADMEAERDGW